MYISEAGKGAVRCWKYRLVDDRELEGACFVPKLSAAMTTPSLNLTPITDVPVTAGDCVCCIGPEVWRYEGSYAP